VNQHLVSRLIKRTFTTTITLACLAASLAASAQELRYVSDKLFVPLRSGMGSSFRITHRGLPSGTALTLLEENKEEGWSRVSTAKGKEGWVQNQYIVNEPIAQIKLVRADKKIAQLTARQTSLNDELKTLRSENTALTSQLGDTNKSSKEVAEELRNIKKISASTLALNDAHNILLQDHQLLQTERDSLTAENNQLKRDRTYNQWIYGAGIMFLGVILTLILQSTGRRKNYSEWA